MAKKLHISPSQHSLIVAMRDGKRLRWSSGIDAHAYLEVPNFPKHTASALALERKGMIERHSETHTGCDFRLTAKAEGLK